MRTNNGAESLHSELNAKVKAKPDFFKFLAALEKQMAKARSRIASKCKPESRPATPEKNRALAVELHKLFYGQQGALEFLDHCGLVVSLDDVEEVQQFAPREFYRQADSEWSLTNRGLRLRAARNLYFRLHPNGQLSDDEIQTKITEWTFQVLPQAEDPNVDQNQSELSLVETGDGQFPCQV